VRDHRRHDEFVLSPNFVVLAVQSPDRDVAVVHWRRVVEPELTVVIRLTGEVVYPTED
jgi:hypothetical protein